MRDVELDPPRPRTAVDRRTTMFASTPSTCTRRTLDLPRKDWDIRYLRYLGNSDIAEKLTEERAQAYAVEHGVSVERAMKKITHVSVRTVWDDVTAEYEELRRETEVQRADSMAIQNARLEQLFSKALSLFSKGDVTAGRLAVTVMGRYAKLNGLDAPTKIAPTDPTGEHQADTGAIDVNTLSEDTLRRVLRDEKREPLDVTRCR